MSRCRFVSGVRGWQGGAGLHSLSVSAAFAGTLLASSPALAQGNTASESEHSPQAGAWALEFEVQPRLSSRLGAAGIAAKRHFTARSAVRFGFLVAIDHSEGEGTRHTDRAYPYDTTLVTSEIENYSDRRDVSLFLHFVRLVGVGDRFGVVLEAGPTGRWISDEYERLDSHPAPSGTYRRTADRDSWSYGLDLSAGFEWFFARRLSLAGRYGISALLTDTDQTDTYDSYNPNDGYWDRRLDITHSDGSSVQTTPAVIPLIAYF